MSNITPSTPAGNPIADALVALAYHLDRKAIANENELRGFIQAFLMEYPVIAHAKESLDLLERLLSARELVSMAEVSNHISKCAPAQGSEVAA